MPKGLTIVVSAPFGGNSFTAYLDGDEDGGIEWGSTIWLPGGTPGRDTHPSSDKGEEIFDEEAILIWDTFECPDEGGVLIEVGTQVDGLMAGYPGEDLNFSVRLLLPQPILLPRQLSRLFGCE